MTTYGLVVAAVAVAALTALVAALVDRPEWRHGGRRRPVLAVTSVRGPWTEGAANGTARDPSHPDWVAALDEVSRRQGGREETRPVTSVPLDEVLAQPPRVAIVDGMSELALAGTPVDRLREEIAGTVAALAEVGARPIVLGVATPRITVTGDGPEGGARVAERRRALRSLIARWNDAVATDIGRYGGVLVTDPGDLPDTVERLDRTGFVPEETNVGWADVT